MYMFCKRTCDKPSKLADDFISQVMNNRIIFSKKYYTVKDTVM